jgi:hypothetical protein
VALTSSRSWSPRSTRTVFAGAPTRIRATSSRPASGGRGFAAGGGARRGASVVERSRSGAGSSAAARVEIASRTIITITNRRAATPIA